MSKKLILSIVLITVIVAACVWAFIFSFQITKNLDQMSLKSSDNSSAGNNSNAENLIVTETKNGQKYWELVAGSGFYDEKKDIVVLKKVKGNFYKDNNIILSFDAPRGQYNQKNKEIFLSGGARALTDKDVFIKAREILLEGKKDLVFASGDVRIKQADKVLTLSDKSVFNTTFTFLKNTGRAQTFVYQ